jgi:hypothetical protein
MAKSVLIIGPKGCGKTLHAEALRQHFHCATICDDWTPSLGTVDGALMLTNSMPGGKLPYHSASLDAYRFDHAMQLMNDAHAEVLRS